MSLIRLEIKTEGEEAVIRDFQNRWGRAKNLTPAMKNFNEYYRREIDSNYNSRGSLFGGWKRRKRAYPHPILSKTGRMKRSFRSDVREQSVEISNDARYFRFHQLGTRKLPKRKMWGVRQVDMVEFQKYIQEYLVKGK